MVRPEISLIIPAYNEAQRIAPTLRAVVAWLTEHHPAYEVLVVNDGSHDDTGRSVEELGLPDVHLIDSYPNRGKGYVVRLGMLTARGRVRVFMDADNSTPVNELPKLLSALRVGADVAIGSRRCPGSVRTKAPPVVRRLWSRLANVVVQAGLVSGIHDTQCGFKAFTAQAAEAIFSRARTPGWGFDLEVLALARRLGFLIAERPVAWSDDRRSRVRPWRDAIRITVEFLKIRRAFRRGEYDLKLLAA